MTHLSNVGHFKSVSYIGHLELYYYYFFFANQNCIFYWKSSKKFLKNVFFDTSNGLSIWTGTQLPDIWFLIKKKIQQQKSSKS